MIKILNGKKISLEMLEQLKKQVEGLKIKKIYPNLAVISIGSDKASQIYLKLKEKACRKIGIKFIKFVLPENVNLKQLNNKINQLNENPGIYSIIIQLPLPKKFDLNSISLKIDLNKDVDGFNYIFGVKNAKFYPATPSGILELLKKYKISLKNKKIAIIGKGFLVGLPLEKMLKEKGIKAITIDKEFNNIKKITQKCDILFSATGVKHLIKKNMIKKDSIIIDAGAPFPEVDYNQVINKASAISPVPGGVGPMTIAMLLKNVVLASILNTRTK